MRGDFPCGRFISASWGFSVEVSEEEQYHQSGRYRAGSASASQSNQRWCKIRAENVVHSPMENWPLTLISKLNFKSEKIINLK